jgi:ABC-2 type transport system ATP-binding protein
VLHEPPILFLDEPTSGVDPNSRRLFWDLIYDLSGRGVTVFVTTHYMEESEYCDRLGVIYRGELIATGAPRELKHRMQETVLAIDCERPNDAMGTIERLPEVREVALFGKGLHAVARAAGDETAAAIRTTLTAAGFAAPRVERITPTLEDVFVSLIEARDREVFAPQEPKFSR